MLLAKEDIRIVVVGLGYVGLPVAVAFASIFKTIGYDINKQRIQGLREGIDINNEVTSQELLSVPNLLFTNDLQDLANSNVYIITVPTPVDDHCSPNFQPLIAASDAVSKVLKPGSIVIYESTVYPGAVEEVCVPILAKGSGLSYNVDFFAGYSPERINPGDKKRKLQDILKVTSGSNAAAADFVDYLYSTIISAGTHKVSSIKVAEAAKVIENTQRDLNIALINELAIIFNKMDLNTEEVLQAAATKWNFVRFNPGLVGGHCIGVDPYYLTYKAQALGYNPEVILAGRRINDNMGKHVAAQIVKKMLMRKIHVAGSKILILGFAFKENCSDFRNTKVIDIVHELQEYGADIKVYDPIVNAVRVQEEYGICLIQELKNDEYDAIILAVAHDEFKKFNVQKLRSLGKVKHILYDVKYMLPAEATDGRL